MQQAARRTTPDTGLRVCPNLLLAPYFQGERKPNHHFSLVETKEPPSRGLLS